MIQLRSVSAIILLTAMFSCVLIGGCAVEATGSSAVDVPEVETAASEQPAKRGATIKIEPNSPADTVRVFYKNLREKKFRQAIFLTNLRPAIEGLTDNELKEFQVDLEAVARQIPADVEINGEIITGDNASVTARLPGNDTDKPDIQEIELRKEKGIWVILTVDESAESRIKKEGKNYFYNLRIETHQDEARAMLDRIAKAQMAFATQNSGQFGDIKRLVDDGLLPDDALNSASTGYNYAVTVTGEGKSYFTTATPAEYGKSGKLSFMVTLNAAGAPVLASKDNGGKTLTN